MYQGYKELVEVLVLDWLRKTALPPWMKHEGNNETLVCPTLCRSTADCWWILNTADKTIFNWMRKWLSKTLQHIYISNKHYEIISLPFIRWGEVRSKQYDANRLLAPRCSFSFHPERKFCCYGDAALQSELTRIFYILPTSSDADQL